ncbi:YgdI/YgdR family lipoprotein [Acerihabitans sp.]|uniref:YgdI/YgdR family lipoprotein n=1 Tax=Acerihabitans sp. TaxID=2811394 RepID=UPI002ED8A378
MKKSLYVLSACVLTLMLAGCADNNYAMHTNDGRTIVSEGKPKVDDQTGMISYKDANGTEQQINRSDVKEMMEIKH